MNNKIQTTRQQTHTQQQGLQAFLLDLETPKHLVQHWLHGDVLFHGDVYLHENNGDVSSFNVLLHGREHWKNLLKNVYENGGFHGWKRMTYLASIQLFVIFPPTFS